MDAANTPAATLALCPECWEEVPKEEIVYGLCALCYDEAFGDYGTVEKFTRKQPIREE